MIFKNTHLLTTILTPALRLWIHSQLQTLQGLDLQINSTDQQLLKGIIPQIFLQSELAVYQGLHFDQISLTAKDIKINLTQVLQGQPLNFLAPFLLFGSLRLTQNHLQASLPSSLLQSGLQDFLSLLLKTDTFTTISWENIILQSQQFILQGKTITSSSTPILIHGTVRLKSPHHLLISPLKVEGLDFHQDISPVTFDLGSQVHLDSLRLTQKAIFIQGKLVIVPS